MRSAQALPLLPVARCASPEASAAGFSARSTTRLAPVRRDTTEGVILVPVEGALERATWIVFDSEPSAAVAPPNYIGVTTRRLGTP